MDDIYGGQSASTSAVVTGLADGVPYVFRVAAISTYGGNGFYSVESNQVTVGIDSNV